MLHPNYVELMNVVNEEAEEGLSLPVNSRYSIVMAAARRARQLVNGSEPLVEAAPKEKALSVAVDELYSGKIQILGQEDDTEEMRQLALRGVHHSVSGADIGVDVEDGEESYSIGQSASLSYEGETDTPFDE